MCVENVCEYARVCMCYACMCVSVSLHVSAALSHNTLSLISCGSVCSKTDCN